MKSFQLTLLFSSTWFSAALRVGEEPRQGFTICITFDEDKDPKWKSRMLDARGEVEAIMKTLMPLYVEFESSEKTQVNEVQGPVHHGDNTVRYTIRGTDLIKRSDLDETAVSQEMLNSVILMRMKTADDISAATGIQVRDVEVPHPVHYPHCKQAPNLVSKYLYIVLREEDNYSMDQTQQKKIFQAWLSQYFGLKNYPENFQVNTVTPFMKSGQKIYVVEFQDVAEEVSQDVVAAKGYAKQESALNFHRVGVVYESAWVLTDPQLECPSKIQGGKEQMGHWHMSVNLAHGQQAWVLFTCELQTPDCTNKQRAVVKVVGKGIRGGVTWIRIPIRLTSSAEQWECTFWWLPNRWADETSVGTTKMCTVKTPQNTNSLNTCQKNYVWQIGNTNFYGQADFQGHPMSGPMFSL